MNGNMKKRLDEIESKLNPPTDDPHADHKRQVLAVARCNLAQCDQTDLYLVGVLRGLIGDAPLEPTAEDVVIVRAIDANPPEFWRNLKLIYGKAGGHE